MIKRMRQPRLFADEVSLQPKAEKSDSNLFYLYRKAQISYHLALSSPLVEEKAAALFLLVNNCWKHVSSLDLMALVFPVKLDGALAEPLLYELSSEAG